ncbi:MAG: DNA gyrase subunit A [Pseudomonadales bacterium]|nr:DNA gyrase subunit A [Pseudomonadales bacterium]
MSNDESQTSENKPEPSSGNGGGSGEGPRDPDDDSREIIPVRIEDELQQSFLGYAMYVIVSRALPDVRDGLKPVHRRVLFAMSELNNTYNRPYMKSARVSGEVMGKYHPHGDAAIYDTIVRLAQDWNMRYPLVIGQGNFGSIDGDPPAAPRYTEVRMEKIAGAILSDLDMETVDFVANYDDTLEIPSVLPTRIPNLLVNGSVGIAVGMATNIPPHNLTEVMNACLALIDEPALEVDGLMEYIKGPDFPTAGIINGRAGIVSAYRTGRGRIYVRARAHVEGQDSGKETIVITEIPYHLNKSKLIEKIAELVKEKKIEGITELRDESDKDGLRIVIELRRGEPGEVLLNKLYSQTQLQQVFGINCFALVDDQPKIVNLKEMLDAFLLHRREVVTRRTIYLLRRARHRGHLLEAQSVAIENIDEIVALIKGSAGPAEAREGLMAIGWRSEVVIQLLAASGRDTCRPDGLDESFGFRETEAGEVYFLSEEQAQSILQMQLSRLTALEKDRLIDEYQTVVGEIESLLEILQSEERLKQVMREEFIEIRDEYGDERKTEIIASQMDLTAEDLIAEEDVVVTVSHQGYAKTQPLSDYQAQKRGGRGRSATAVRDEDFVEHLVIANTHAMLLCFSDTGKVYWLKVYEIPQASRGARGRPLVNMLPLGEEERITAIQPIGDFEEDSFVFMATANGTVKKTPLEQFSRPRPSGLIALELEEGNTLVDVSITDGSCDIVLVTTAGKAVRFKESDVRAMGRNARGVRGIRIVGQHKLISLIVPEEEAFMLTASEFGYGKRTPMSEFPIKGRATQGVIAIQASDRNGKIVGATQVVEDDQVMLISDQGTLVRTSVSEISVQGRNTQGVRLIAVRENERLVGLERVVETDDDSDNGDVE